MSCDNPDHAELEAELETALDDVMRLEEELQASQRKGGKSQSFATAAEAAALVEANDKLVKEKERYREDALTQKGRVRDLEAEVEQKDVSVKELEKKRRKLEDDLENTRKMLQAEKTRAAEASKQLGATEKKGRTEQRDQAKLLAELQELRELAAELHSQLAAKDESLAELDAATQQLAELNASLEAQSEEQRAQVQELQHKLEEARAELAEANDHIAVGAEAEEEYERRLEEQQSRAQQEAAALTAELEKQRVAAAAALKELTQLKGEPLCMILRNSLLAVAICCCCNSIRSSHLATLVHSPDLTLSADCQLSAGSVCSSAVLILQLRYALRELQ
jgi:chromosome segregation ATPase